jgi:hypothetical protein
MIHPSHCRKRFPNPASFIGAGLKNAFRFEPTKRQRRDRLDEEEIVRAERTWICRKGA